MMYDPEPSWSEFVQFRNRNNNNPYIRTASCKVEVVETRGFTDCFTSAEQVLLVLLSERHVQQGRRCQIQGSHSGDLP